MVRIFSKEKFEKEKARFEKQGKLYDILPRECTGVLIAPSLILTAGHCVCIARIPDTRSSGGPTAASASATTGHQQRKPGIAYKAELLKDKSIEAVMDHSECASRVQAETLSYREGAEGGYSGDTYYGSATAHPRFELYFATTENTTAAWWIDSDLAIISLDKPVENFPIYEPEWSYPSKGHEVVMIGYGPGDTHPLYGQRHMVENKITGYTQSESSDIRLVIEAKHLPDGGLTAYATPGDSGGGCVSKASPTRLLGISSITATTKEGRKASIFTSINAHRSWLEKQLEPHLRSQKSL
jgi:hypothetical protein